MSFSFPPNKVASSAAMTRTEPLLTVEQLKARYLFGIKLTDEDGNEMPKETMEHAINSAISYLEHKLDVIIQPTNFVERYDYNQLDYTNFNFIQLKKRPLNSVELIRAKFPTNTELVRYPEQWYVLEKEAAQVQLVPVEGTFSGLIVTNGGSYVPLIYGNRSHWPHLFEITYTAGFCPDEIPVLINDMIGMKAAIRIFEIMGDILLGAGIASESVGLDGANASKNTTASAMYSAFSARVEGYKKEISENVKVVRAYYNGFQFTVV